MSRDMTLPLSFETGMSPTGNKVVALVLKNCTLCSLRFIHRIKQAEYQMLNAPDAPAKEIKGLYKFLRV